MTETASLFSLFLGSLLAATLLPGGSELMLVGVLKTQPDLRWPALLLATAGNTLGSLITFAMGWLLPQKKQLKYLDKLQRYGLVSLLLAWLPIVGDALCLAAGWLHLPPVRAALLIALGKFVRYWLIFVMVM